MPEWALSIIRYFFGPSNTATAVALWTKTLLIGWRSDCSFLFFLAIYTPTDNGL
jgi:hypothetical protein